MSILLRQTCELVDTLLTYQQYDAACSVMYTVRETYLAMPGFHLYDNRLKYLSRALRRVKYDMQALVDYDENGRQVSCE